MTTSRRLKRRVRDRMARTGETYMQARSVLLAEQGPRPREDPIAVALTPGLVTGVVCGSGMYSFALLMPYLLKLEDRGHHLTYVMSEREGILELPSPFDFICARSLAAIDEMADKLSAEDPADVHDLIRRLPDASSIPGPMAAGTWREHLLEKRSSGRPPVVWVQDVQVGPPLALGGDSGFDGIAAQLAGLRELATETDAIIALGHCMPYDSPDGWDLIVDGVDNTFVIETDGAPDGAGRLSATIEHHSSGGPPDPFQRKIDTSFDGWRSQYVQRTQPA